MSNIIPPTDTPIINKEHIDVLASLSDDNSMTFINDLLETYKESWNTNIEKVQLACTEKDNDTLRKAIHQISGSSANVGLFRLGALCHNIEEQLHHKKFSDYENCTKTLKEEYNTSIQALNDYIDSL